MHMTHPRQHRRALWVAALVGLMIAGTPALGWAQSAAPSDSLVQRRLNRAFAEGDARALLDPAPDRLAVSLFGARSFYSKAQAVYVLRDFFKEYPPQRFEVRTVSRAPSSHLLVGRYWHAQARRPLSVYLHLRYRDQWWLEEVRIE